MNDTVLCEFDGDLVEGIIVSRPNRFVLSVDFGDGTERVYLGDPGALEFVSPKMSVLCSPVEDPSRKTAYDAIAVDLGEFFVSLRAAFANELFQAALERDLLPRFDNYEIVQREPELPTHGRSDFLLRSLDHDAPVYVEVKSCTHADDGVGKFPDRPTERGRRHLESLRSRVSEGEEAHLVFVAQRPDIGRIEPYREVDPEFADLLAEVDEAGVGIHAIKCEFDPPQYVLRNTDIPVVR